jgi:release factor glutamine methyltransferase
MTLSQALKVATKRLKESCSRPRFEAELLLAYHIDKDRIYLHIHEDEILKDIDGYIAIVERRAESEPYEYITNRASFYDISLEVGEGVLIPRPETELLIDRVAKIIEAEDIDSIVEIGIGSGAISIVLARIFPHLHILATDISPKAISIAQKNIKSFCLDDRIEVIERNLIDSIDSTPQLVVSNPPYIAKDFLLESNVVDYEPHTALFGGEVGDELLHKIVDSVYSRGIRYLACEMGYDQRVSMQRYIEKLKPKFIEFYQDLAGFDRGFMVEFR